jgi:hypothetical protein
MKAPATNVALLGLIYQDGEPLSWIKATKIGDISKVNTPLDFVITFFYFLATILY